MPGGTLEPGAASGDAARGPMLVELSIHDLALIEHTELALGPGLNVITGETGAGKSLLVAALELLLGQTPRGGAAHWVRLGAEKATVEARVVVEDPEQARRITAFLRSELPALALDWDSAGTGHQRCDK